jgi:hypothetical protein
MSVQGHEETTSVFEALGPTLHRYPGDPRYRKSGAREPQPGDIAYCGWVKSRRSKPAPYGSANCLACLRLDGIAGQS